jgi:hypothetical protein
MSKVAVQLDDQQAFQLCLDVVNAGDIAVLYKSNTPIAEMHPLPQDAASKEPRQVGIFPGVITMAENFNDPDPEFEDLFYNGPIFP